MKCAFFFVRVYFLSCLFVTWSCESVPMALLQWISTGLDVRCSMCVCSILTCTAKIIIIIIIISCTSIYLVTCDNLPTE